MITVVIPYFQKETGILAKALRSIAAQQSVSMPIHVLVVDDASPIRAEAELALAGPVGFTVQIIRQTNGGPGSARNMGIENAPAATRYIAFLDSDDEWSPDHLARATTVLGCGYDFYFADHYQLDASIGAFARAGRIQPADHPQLPGLCPGLHAYQGDMLDQIIRGNVIGTSTVVYDLHTFPQQRFKVEFTNAGEDYLFWMELAHRGAKVAFSSQCEARYGRGVNVYAGAGWGTEQHLLRLHNEIKYKKLTCQLFPITSRQRLHIKTNLRDLRCAFVRGLLHRIARRKKLPLPLLRAHLRLSPVEFLLLPLAVAQSFLGRWAPKPR